MTIDLWLTFVAASTALLLIPGPTVLLVLSYALSRGRSVAVASAAGVATGDLIAMSVSLAGLGTLVLTSAHLFVALKWVGAVYLVWLGIGLLRSAPTSGQTEVTTPGREVTASNVYLHAATVTAVNPKSIVFFIAFVPQFLRPDQSLLPQIVVLIATFVGLAGLNALIYALLADRMRTAIARPRVLTWFTRTGGTALIGMGVMSALMRRP
ncbi:MAG: LysE family translocator [Marinibacterium sp.]